MVYNYDSKHQIDQPWFFFWFELNAQLISVLLCAMQIGTDLIFFPKKYLASSHSSPYQWNIHSHMCHFEEIEFFAKSLNGTYIYTI